MIHSLSSFTTQPACWGKFLLVYIVFDAVGSKFLAQHLTKKRFLVVNISVSEDESRLLAEEGTEFEYQSSASKARKDSQEETPVALVKTVQSRIEGQFSMLATSLQEGFVNLGKILTNGIKTSHQNPSSSSGSSGSQSDQEDEQPPPKRSKTQELSDDDVTKDVNELMHKYFK